MMNQQNKNGYSLVEVLVSIAVLLIVIVGPMSIATQGIRSSNFALEQNAAFFLAQEGIEAIFVLRDSALLERYDDIEANLLSGSYATPEDAIAASVDSWVWVDDIYSGVCSGVSNGSPCSFGIDFADDTPANNFTANMCDGGNENNCVLYYDVSNPRAVYTHSGTDESMYTRIVTIEEVQANAEVEVTVTVSWESQVFGGATQTVTQTTRLFDQAYF